MSVCAYIRVSTFYKLYHGQRGGLIEADPNHGERITITFKAEHDKEENK